MPTDSGLWCSGPLREGVTLGPEQVVQAARKVVKQHGYLSVACEINCRGKLQHSRMACCFSGKQFSPRVVELRIAGYGSSLTYKQTNKQTPSTLRELQAVGQQSDSPPEQFAKCPKSLILKKPDLKKAKSGF